MIQSHNVLRWPVKDKNGDLNHAGFHWNYPFSLDSIAPNPMDTFLTQIFQRPLWDMKYEVMLSLHPQKTVKVPNILRKIQGDA